MGNDDKTNNYEEIVLRFGLVIDKIIKGGTTRFEMKFHNTGIPEAEVILYLETLLEKMKENFKQPIKDGFTFFKPKGDEK